MTTPSITDLTLEDANPGGQDLKQLFESEIEELEIEKYLHRLARLPQKVEQVPGQKFVVMSYVLTEPQNGSHGMLIPISVHSNYQDANNKVKKIISDTGVKLFCIYPMMQWSPLLQEPPLNMIQYVDKDGEAIDRLEKKQIDDEIDRIKADYQYRLDREEQQIKMNQEGTIENYAAHWTRAIRLETEINSLNKKLSELVCQQANTIKIIQRVYTVENEDSLDQYVTNNVTNILERETLINIHHQMKHAILE